MSPSVPVWVSSIVYVILGWHECVALLRMSTGLAKCFERSSNPRERHVSPDCPQGQAGPLGLTWCRLGSLCSTPFAPRFNFQEHLTNHDVNISSWFQFYTGGVTAALRGSTLCLLLVPCYLLTVSSEEKWQCAGEVLDVSNRLQHLAWTFHT